MKKLYFLFFLIFSLCCRQVSVAQLVTGEAFLQGTYLEIGVDSNGTFGTDVNAPAGYHPHGFTEMSAVYDWGHDGWTVGTPTKYMGDYWLPGFSQEGWAIMANGTMTECYAPYAPTGAITFGPLSYASGGGTASATFTANFNGLTITQVSSVDVGASWVVINATLQNTSTAAVNNVYYMRTCDPDNAATWTSPTGGYSTVNTIVHQNDADHRVQVSAYDPGYGALSTYSAIVTKDCRAKAFYDPDGLVPSDSLDQDYAGTALAGLVFTGTLTDDISIGVVWKLGTIAPGASVHISYAYVFDNNNGIDSALRDPQMVVNGDTIPDAPAPNITYDTFNACTLPPGVTSVPVTIAWGNVNNWSLSSWVWAPGLGLTTTTGLINSIDLTTLTGPTTYIITGDDSTGGMMDCAHRVFYLTILPCHTAFNNHPCLGDTLKLTDKGDSTGFSYLWTGPGGFTSTLQSPFIFPAVYPDSGLYHVVKYLGGTFDYDSTYVIVHAPPVVIVSSNSPLCSTSIDTLHLSATPDTVGDTFAWTGPARYTSSLEFPSVTPFGAPQTGLYWVTITTIWGCKDSAATDAELIAPPPAPVIHGITSYCQGTTFVPFTVTNAAGAPLDSGLLWYLVPTGGLSTTTPLTINTSVPGTYTVYVSQKLGSCEGPRGSLTVVVRTTPPAPLVTGTMQYCQYIGPFVPLVVHTVTGGTANWYTSATGGTASATEPTPNINVAGVNSYWVSQTDSGCESPRQPVTITIHPQPAPPVVHPQPWCQFRTPGPVSATPSEAGDNLLWYGPGVTVGTSTAPTPGTNSAPDTIVYYVTETSSFGCVSDSAVDREIIIVKPAPPITMDTWYCQYGTAVGLNAEVDSAANSNLNWYFNGTLLPSTPVPPTDTTPGSTTWYVTQTVNTCESDSGSVTVTILYKPVFGITPGQPWVCQFDSISLKYNGPALVYPNYSWTLPAGATFGAGTDINEDSVIVVFDSAVLYNYVVLTVSDDSGKCTSDTSIRINVVAQPTAGSYTKPDVCLGDTVVLALNTKSDDANNYAWYIDSVMLQSSPAITVVTSNSNTGGPFSISWVDSGQHVIEVWSYSEEGCKSAPTFDSVYVHAVPDAHFKISSETQSGCIGDTVQFTADVAAYNNLYVWSPAHSFENVNTPSAWGQIEEANTIITLTVTDPFGCVATESMEVDPQSCCTVSFPNAFTPNGDTKNDFFRPIYTGGYHHFHVFRIVNRWGQTVFSSENSSVQWDGNYNGVPQDMGTYYYYIKYDCGGKTIEQKGDVTLMR